MKIILTDDGSRTLYCEKFAENFHSASGAISEALHVYLLASGAQRRLQDGIPTRILEIGFGAGLNFFVTADCAIANQTPLDYLAIDDRPIEPSIVRELGYARLIECAELVDAYLSTQTDHPQHTRPNVLNFQFRGLVSLTTQYRNAVEPPDGPFDCIYHDAFSPDHNPELWTRAFLGELFVRLDRGGSLVTYCCKAEIQQILRDLGFAVHKQAGPPGGKREMLIANRRR